MAPDDARTQFSLGLTLKAMGREDEAQRALCRAAELDPGRGGAQRLLDVDVIL